jgi:hypothetical protein
MLGLGELQIDVSYIPIQRLKTDFLVNLVDGYGF